MPSNIKDYNFIPQPLYDQIIKCLPIVSVEAVIVKDNALLFLKRNNEPVKGEWWFPGGRIHKGESLKQTLCREIKEETDLEIIESKLINVYSRVFPKRHDITIVYLCKCKEGKIELNNEHSKYAFFKTLPKDLHPCLIEVIQDCKLNDFRP
jgi:colanic acid biosynthesis protein WcaH